MHFIAAITQSVPRPDTSLHLLATEKRNLIIGEKNVPRNE